MKNRESKTIIVINWIYDPYWHWNVPTESWQQDDAVVDKPYSNIDRESSSSLFKSEVTGPKFNAPRGKSLGYPLPYDTE